MQTNNSKEKVRQLQNKLYLTAKKCNSRRFHALYDKVYRDDILIEAWKRVKANPDLYMDILKAGFECVQIGDNVKPGKIINAIHQGYHCIRVLEED